MSDAGLQTWKPPLAFSAENALQALQSLCVAPALRAVRATDLLTERARLLGGHFRHGESFAGTCRLLQARDGTVALNLPRPDDWDLLSAWLETVGGSLWRWSDIASVVQERPIDGLIERGRLLGLALAPTGRQPERGAAPAGSPAGRYDGGQKTRRPRVVDLSALWAGPLCGHLLHLCGADVIKVESTSRPDGARLGNPGFYGLLNQGKRCVGLDLTTPEGQRLLSALIDRADIVIESSRPRALRQMGIDPEILVRQRARLTWISITGYGRQEPQANWVAFGDDAAVAAGLSDLMKTATGHYQFAGDAVADPLTGIGAALIAWHSWLRGSSSLISLSLTQVAARGLDEEVDALGEPAVARNLAAWWRRAQTPDWAAHLPARAVIDPVGIMGADTTRVLDDWNIRC